MTKKKYLTLLWSVRSIEVRKAMITNFETSCQVLQASVGLMANIVDIVKVHHSSIMRTFSLRRNTPASPARLHAAPATADKAASFATGKVRPKDHVSRCGYM